MRPLKKSLTGLGIQRHEYFTDPEFDKVSGDLNLIAVGTNFSVCAENKFYAFRQRREDWFSHNNKLRYSRLQEFMKLDMNCGTV